MHRKDHPAGRRGVHPTARRAAALAGLAALASTTLATPSASAADTLVTFEVGATGVLSVSAPASADLGDGVDGGSLSNALGSVTVSDSRNSALTAWAATVTASDATRQGGGGTIPKVNITYTSGPTTKTSGTVALTNGALAATPTPLGLTLPVVSAAGSGSSIVTWTPTLEIGVPTNTPAGTYTLTLTHSVL